MAYIINAGDLRTACVVERPITRYDDAAEPLTEWENVFGEGKFLWCHVELSALERETDGNREVVEDAKITTRYTAAVAESCRIYRRGEQERPFLIEEAVPLAERRGWMIIRAKRKKAAV